MRRTIRSHTRFAAMAVIAALLAMGPALPANGQDNASQGITANQTAAQPAAMSGSEPEAAPVSGAPNTPPSPTDGPLRFANWPKALPLSVLEDFTRETGIPVDYSEYQNDEELFAALEESAQDPAYDLAAPSSYVAERLLGQDMIEPLNPALIPNLSNLDPLVLNKTADPEARHLVPYLWGGVGIGRNAKEIQADKASSWRDLWRKDYAGKLLLTDDMREVFGVALLRLGYSVNDPEPKHALRAFESLRSLVASAAGFDSINAAQWFGNSTALIGMVWNGQAREIREAAPEFAFVWPREGGIMWVDSLVIPKSAAHAAQAHALINFLLRPDIAARITEATGYATANALARESLPEDLRNDPAVYPPSDVVQRSEFLRDMGEGVSAYQAHWEKLRSGE